MVNRARALDAAWPPERGLGLALLQHTRLGRPYAKLWFVLLPTATMGLWLQGPSPALGPLALTMLCFVLADAGATTLNDVCDRHTDRASVEPGRRERPVAGGAVSARAALVQVALLDAAALTVAALVSPALLAIVSLGVAYGVAYSARPVYATGRPIVSQLFWVVVWPAFYLAVYLALTGDFAHGLPFVAATVVFMGVGETLAKDLRDLHNDARTGKRTTPVAFGASRCAHVATLAFGLGSIGYVAAASVARPDALALAAAVALLGALWCGRAASLGTTLARRYTQAGARALHVESIRAFSAVNVVLAVGLLSAT